MTEFVLRVTDRLAWLLTRLGVDYPQFRALLEVKLTLDGRRRTAVQAQAARQDATGGLRTVLIMYGLFGLFVGGIFLMTRNLFAAAVLEHAFVMIMLAMTLISDFSSVLLDTTDNKILQSRPISGRTIYAARLAHIIAYVTLLGGSLAAAGLVFGTYRYGVLFALLLLLTLAASVLFTVSAVNVFYLLILRITSAERLRDVILYCQIIFTVLFIGGYQILPRLFNTKLFEEWDPAGAGWIYLLPPAWLAGPFGMLSRPQSATFVILTVLSAAVPLLALLLSTLLAPGFKDALARLEAVDTLERAADKAKVAAAPQHRRAGRWSWVASDPGERAAVDFFWAIMDRDRHFKLRTYPSVAMAFLLGGIMIFGQSGNPFETLRTLGGTQKHLVLLYVCAMIGPNALTMLRYSDKFEAAWIFESLPIGRTGLLLRAALKVVLLRLVLPAYLIMSALVLLVWPISVAPDVILAGVLLVLLTVLEARQLTDRLPFSVQFTAAANAGRSGYMLAYTLLAAALGGGHFALSLAGPVPVAAAIPVALLAAGWSLRSYGQQNWTSLPKTKQNLSDA